MVLNLKRGLDNPVPCANDAERVGLLTRLFTQGKKAEKSAFADPKLDRMVHDIWAEWHKDELEIKQIECAADKLDRLKREQALRGLTDKFAIGLMYVSSFSGTVPISIILRSLTDDPIPPFADLASLPSYITLTAAVSLTVFALTAKYLFSTERKSKENGEMQDAIREEINKLTRKREDGWEIYQKYRDRLSGRKRR
ncbi:Uncharacterised protein [uncultured archaeon]|nr:Uncharacterised protein [uncultured archaeon]